MCGKPVIASMNRGHKELIKEDITVYLINPSDIDLFSNKILWLYREKNHRNNLGYEAINAVKDFKIENVINELKNIYEVKKQDDNT